MTVNNARTKKRYISITAAVVTTTTSDTTSSSGNSDIDYQDIWYGNRYEYQALQQPQQPGSYYYVVVVIVMLLAPLVKMIN
jgi:hypothetical protein